MQAVSPVPDHDSIVAEPPRLVRQLVPLMFVAGLAYAWYLWHLASHGTRVSWSSWELAGVLLLCGIAGLFQGTRRVVIDRACVSEYRGGRLLRQYPLREITALRLEFNAVRLVFADRRAITIPNIWPGASELRHHLQSVIDLRAGGAPPVDDWLPLNYLTFPSRCVSCGSREVVEHTIFAGTRIHMPNVTLVRGFDIAVPACRRCSRRRKAVGFSATLGLIVGSIGLFVAAIASERFEAISFSVFLIGFMMVFVIIHVAINQARRWLDRRLLGVAALRLGKDKATVQLWFRDRQVEIEVRALTAESRTREMSSAAGILRGLDHESTRH